MPDPYEEITEVLNRAPEVRWDRVIPERDQWTIYGWLPREDGQSDAFVIVFSYLGFGVGIFLTWEAFTTAANHPVGLFERLDIPQENQTKCVRVEDLFPKVASANRAQG